MSGIAQLLFKSFVKGVGTSTGSLLMLALGWKIVTVLSRPRSIKSKNETSSSEKAVHDHDHVKIDLLETAPMDFKHLFNKL